MTKPTDTIVPSPQYFDLKSLAIYASCSVRWLRDRLSDRVHPLPHFRIEGKLLVKRDDFDHWMAKNRIVGSVENLGELVDSIVAQVQTSQPRS